MKIEVILFFSLAIPLAYAWDAIRDLRKEIKELKKANAGAHASARSEAECR
jgi:hypothetical protein